MAEAIGRHDWASTSAGPIDSWPRALRTVVQMMLHQRHAICLFWGSDLNIFYNDAYRPFLGAKEKDALGKPFSVIWSDVWDDVKCFVDEALSGKGTYTENMRLIMDRNGYAEETFWTFSYSPLNDDDGNVAGLIDIAVDTTPMVRSLRAQEVFRHKLVHRVKNSMAVTTAVISATLRHAETLDQARQTITHRIAALGKAQNMLNSAPADVNVTDVISESMSAHLDDPRRLTISGPELHVTTQQGIGLSLAVCELATNALKYGALSNQTGRVEISWTTSAAQGFEFVWQETDGPTVKPPTRKGFGSRLTNQILAAHFSGKGETNYFPEGVRFVLSGNYQTEADAASLQSGIDLVPPNSSFRKDIAMDKTGEFAVSSNGDRWLLEKDAGSKTIVVVHQANPPSGGYETRMSVGAFLAQTPSTPEREALLALLNPDGSAENGGHGGEKTPSLKLAEEYLRLGGSRRAKVDDNIVSTRKWESEPPEAETFWKENVEPMDDKRRQEVEVHLPSISET